MARPTVPPGVVPVSFRLPLELDSRLRREANKRGLSLNKLVAEMLTVQLDYWDTFGRAEANGAGS